jgi:hypothetical protein
MLLQTLLTQATLTRCNTILRTQKALTNRFVPVPIASPGHFDILMGRKVEKEVFPLIHKQL